MIDRCVCVIFSLDTAFKCSGVWQVGREFGAAGAELKRVFQVLKHFFMRVEPNFAFSLQSRPERDKRDG